ncbi:hypothetical protein [Streptomyces avermitilis]|nr:hypothetical protein [Streptomyces avermitilis]
MCDGEGDGVAETVAVTVTAGGRDGVATALAARSGSGPPETRR